MFIIINLNGKDSFKTDWLGWLDLACIRLAGLGWAWLELAWYGLDWLGVAWLGLAWFGISGMGFVLFSNLAAPPKLQCVYAGDGSVRIQNAP